MNRPPPPRRGSLSPEDRGLCLQGEGGAWCTRSPSLVSLLSLCLPVQTSALGAEPRAPAGRKQLEPDALAAGPPRATG